MLKKLLIMAILAVVSQSTSSLATGSSRGSSISARAVAGRYAVVDFGNTEPPRGEISFEFCDANGKCRPAEDGAGDASRSLFVIETVRDAQRLRVCSSERGSRSCSLEIPIVRRSGR